MMLTLSLPRIKICCIANLNEARLAIRYGADAIGLVGAMPSGPGPITDAEIATIARSAPPPIATFLLTSETEIGKIILHHRRVHTNTIQLVDTLQGGKYAELRSALPGVKLVQVIHVLNESSVAEALQVAGEVDALLLDSGNPHAPVKQLGGTGRVHDWALSRQIRDQVQTPVFLAGGLNAGNIERAIEIVQPFGVDLCSGVRTNSQLDENKLAAFVKAVRCARK